MYFRFAFLHSPAQPHPVHAITRMPVLHKNRSPAKNRANTRGLQILVCEISPVAVGLKPIVKMELVQVGSDDLFPHLMSLRAQEWNAPAGKGRNQGLHHAIGIAR